MPRLIVGNDVESYPYPAVRVEAWEHRAACRNTDPSMWDASDAASARVALRICAGCPVLVECRKQNLDLEYGIVGGLTERQRRRLRKGDPTCTVCGAPANERRRCPQHRPCRECARHAVPGKTLCAYCREARRSSGAGKRVSTTLSVCSVDGCGGKPKGLGLCGTHYVAEWRRRRREAAS